MGEEGSPENVYIPEEREEGEEELETQLAQYFSDDEITKGLIINNFPQLIPLDSRLHSLTYIEGSEAKALKYRINAIVALIEAGFELNKWNQDRFLTLQSVREHLKLRINDSLKGRKLKALTERVRVIETRQTGIKKGWLK